MTNENLRLEKYLQMPENVWGFLEWTTGVVRVNLSNDELKNINESEIAFMDYKEALAHEYYHLLQISTSGYLYHFVTELLVDIIPYWKDAMIDGEQAKGTDIFIKILSDIPTLNEKIKIRFAEIDVVNGSGVSTREIIEGAAFLFQKLFTNNSLTSEQFEDDLKYYEQDYNNSYKYLKEVFGDKAFKYLPILSFIALCFVKPQDFFDDICKEISSSKYDNIELKLEEILKIAQDLRVKHVYIGTPIEVEDYIYRRKHYNPFYNMQINKIVKYCQDNGVNFFSLMCYPHKTLKMWNSNKIETSLIYNPEDIVSPFEDDEMLDVADQKFKSSTMLVLSTLCLIINKNNAHGPKFMKSKYNKSPNRVE